MTGVFIGVAVLLAAVAAVRIPRMVRAVKRANRQIAAAFQQELDRPATALPAPATKENPAA